MTNYIMTDPKLTRIKGLITGNLNIWSDPHSVDYPSDYKIELISEELGESSIHLNYLVGNDKVEIIIKK